MAKPALDILALSAEERLELIGDLWDSLDAAPVPLSAEQSAELARRVADLEQFGPTGSSWTDVEARIRTRSQ